MLDESREACGAQVGVTGSSPLQTYFRERERETKVPSPVSTPHPSITPLGFLLFNHLLCSDCFTSTVCTARVFMDASEGHVSSLLSTQCIMMLAKLYSKDSFFPFQFLYRLPHFTFSWLPSYCCNTHPQTACLLLKVVAILGCVAVEYLVACLSDSKEKTSQNMMTSPYWLTLVMLKIEEQIIFYTSWAI
jgi:hypothetical protein